MRFRVRAANVPVSQPVTAPIWTSESHHVATCYSSSTTRMYDIVYRLGP